MKRRIGILFSSCAVLALLGLDQQPAWSNTDNGRLVIAHFFPGFVPVVKGQMTGTEGVGSTIVENQVSDGHEVHVFASDRSFIEGAIMHYLGPANNDGTDPERKQLEIHAAEKIVQQFVHAGLWGKSVYFAHTSEVAPFINAEANRRGDVPTGGVYINHNYNLTGWEDRAAEFPPETTIVAHPGTTAYEVYNSLYEGTGLTRVLQPHPVFGDNDPIESFESVQRHHRQLTRAYQSLGIAEQLPLPTWTPETGKYLVSLGLRSHKGAHHAVDALAALHANYPTEAEGVRLVLLGGVDNTPASGPWVRNTLVKHILEAGMEKHVAFYGSVAPALRDAVFEGAWGSLALLDKDYPVEIFGVAAYQKLRFGRVLGVPKAATHPLAVTHMDMVGEDSTAAERAGVIAGWPKHGTSEHRARRQLHERELFGAMSVRSVSDAYIGHARRVLEMRNAAPARRRSP